MVLCFLNGRFSDQMNLVNKSLLRAKNLLYHLLLLPKSHCHIEWIYLTNYFLVEGR